ncbi:MAG: zf-HC2 domain-containing protein [Pseudomonadota bacterium]
MTDRSSSTSPCEDQTIVWYLNDSLDNEAKSQFEEHLLTCEACRHALRTEKQIFSHIRRNEKLPLSAKASFAPLRELIESDISNNCAADGTEKSAALTFWATTARLAAACLLGALLYRNFGAAPNAPPDDGYITRSESTATADLHLQVVFNTDLTVSEMGRVLARVDGRIVNGPTAGGVFIVVAGDGSLTATTAAAAHLSQDARVDFVAKIDGDAPR